MLQNDFEICVLKPEVKISAMQFDGTVDGFRKLVNGFSNASFSVSQEGKNKIFMVNDRYKQFRIHAKDYFVEFVLDDSVLCSALPPIAFEKLFQQEKKEAEITEADIQEMEKINPPKSRKNKSKDTNKDTFPSEVEPE